MTTSEQADLENQADTAGTAHAGLDALRRALPTLPATPGVYRMLDSGGEVLYVGKARNLKRRVTSYTQLARLPIRLQRMVAQTSALEVVTTHTEAEALLLEANLIKRLTPRYNVLLRDDKSFPYILLTSQLNRKILKTGADPQKRRPVYCARAVPQCRGRKSFVPYAQPVWISASRGCRGRIDSSLLGSMNRSTFRCIRLPLASVATARHSCTLPSTLSPPRSRHVRRWKRSWKPSSISFSLVGERWWRSAA